MESRLPVMAKKVWSLVRVMLIKKGIAKRKFLLDLNMMMKRGKIAGKALHKLMFHHHHHHHNWAVSALHRHPQHLSFTMTPPGEYEFRCNDTPPYPLSLFSKKHQNKRQCVVTTTKLPLAAMDDCDDLIIDPELLKALDILIANSTGSPPLPGSMGVPMVEPLRIKDSPIALISHGDKDDQVDEAVERFIMRFYNDRIREN